MSARRVPSESIREGDVLLVLGTERKVTKIGPHGGPTELYDGWRLAHSGSDWFIALPPGQSYWCVDRA